MSVRINVDLYPFGVLTIKSLETASPKSEPQAGSSREVVYTSPHRTSSFEYELVYTTDGTVYSVPATTG